MKKINIFDKILLLVLIIVYGFVFASWAMGGMYDTSYMKQYSQNLSTAITRIGTSHKRLVFHDTVTLSADCNAPDNIAFDISENGLITLGNYDLFIHGDFHCEPGNKAFNVSGTGRVYFRGNIDRVYPEWFGAVGDGVTDDTNAFTYAHGAGQGIIELGSKTYDISTLRIQQPMKGISHQKSIIDVTGTGLYLSPTDTEKFIEISDIKINGTNADNDSILIDCNQSRGYLRNLWLSTDADNNLTGIRLKQSHHSALDHILLYGGSSDGFQTGIYVQGIPGANVNNVSYSEIHIADANYAITIEEDSFNNVWDTVYIEACNVGINFRGVNGCSFNNVWWDDVNTWIYAPIANYSHIVTDKRVQEVLANSSGSLYDTDIQGRGVYHVKKLAAESTKAFTLSTDPNSMEAIGNLPPEVRLFGWNRGSDTHYGYTQGGICFSLRPTYGKITAFTYDDTTSIQCWEIDPTSRAQGYMKEKVVGGNGEFFQTAIRSNEITLSGATTEWDEAILIGRRILGVCVYVTETITGSGVTGYQIGDGTDADRWGNINSLAAGTDTSPSDFTDESVMIYNSLTDAIFTAVGGTFSGGKIRAVVYFQEFSAPTS